MKNPPLVLLQAIRKALKAKQATGDDVDAGHAHAGLYHDGFTGTIQPPIIPALNNQGGVGKQRWDTGVVDVVIPLYSFYAQGDNVVLYVDDVYVDDQTVRDTNVNLVFAAPIGAFNPSPTTPDYQADVHYHTIDQLGGNETASRATLLPVKLTVPGNPREDLPPGTVVNDRLAAPVGVPSEIIPLPGVDLPVLIPAYAYMHTGDIVTLSWAGASIVHPPLTADQVGKSLTFSVPYDILAARPGAAREVRYWVRDRVQNYSLFSPSVYSDVAEQATLIPPILIGQSGPGFDVDALNGGPVLVLIPIADLLPGDRVKVHFTGQPVDWPYLHHVTEEQPFSGSSLTFSVPNPLAHSLVASTLNLYYQVQRGANTLRSQSLILPLTGTALSLPAPQIPSAAGGEVAPPAGAIDIEIVVFANSAFTVGSVVEIVWRGIDGGGDEHLHSQSQAIVNAGAAVLFRAPIAWVNEIAGGALEVTYNLRVGGQTYASQTLRHNVAGEASLLPAPEFDPALNEKSELNIDLLVRPFAALVEVSNPAFAGAMVTLAWTGSSAADVIELGPVPVVPSALRFPIDRIHLIEPNLDQNVAVSYRIQRLDGRQARSRTALLSVINNASLHWPKAQVVDASNQAVDRLEPILDVGAGQWEINTATVVVSDARLHQGDRLDVFWQLPDGSCPPLAPATATDGESRVDVPASVLSRSFGATVSITYVAIINGVPAPLSDEKMLIVANPSPGAFLPPVIEQAAIGTTLDMNSFEGDASVRIPGYPFMELGQTFWLVLSGTRDDDTAWFARLGSAPFLVEQADLTAGSIVRGLERRALLRLKHGSRITVSLKVGLSGSDQEHSAFTFPSTTLTLVQQRLFLQPPHIERLASDNSVEIWGTTGSLKVTAVYRPHPGEQVQVIWRGPPGQTPVFSPLVPRLMPDHLEFDIPNHLAAQDDGNTVGVDYRVARTEGAAWEHSSRVQVHVVAIPDSHIEDFSTETPRYLPVGVAERLRYFSVEYWGAVAAIDATPIESNLIKGNALHTYAESGFVLTLHRAARQITFDVDSSSRRQIDVIYTWEDGHSVHATYVAPMHVVFSDPQGTGLIASVRIAAPSGGNLFIDNIELEYFWDR